jgi:hypothetical protein
MAAPTRWLPVGMVETLLDPVIPLASTDSILPLINRVRMRRSGPWMIATASDRYVAGASRQRANGDCPLDGWAVEIPLDQAKQLVSLAKQYRRARWMVMPLALDGGRLACGHDAELVFDLPREPMPPIEALIKNMTEERAPNPGAPFGLNADLIKRFSAAQRVYGGYPGTGRVLTLAHGKGLAITVRVGEDFVGVIMGCRLPEAHRPQWWDDVEPDA